MKIKSENTEEHKKLRTRFFEETGIYAVIDNESYMCWLENELVKNLGIADVRLSLFNEVYDKFVECENDREFTQYLNENTNEA